MIVAFVFAASDDMFEGVGVTERTTVPEASVIMKKFGKFDAVARPVFEIGAESVSASVDAGLPPEELVTAVAQLWLTVHAIRSG